MKNTLLTTTAIAMTGFAGAASAAEYTAGAVTMNLSGYYTTTLAIASVDTNDAAEDFDGFDIHTNAEIWFKPSITLDNGIKIGVDVQLEAGSNTNSDQIDESYITVSGDFGKFIIGSENSVGYKMTVDADDVSHIFAHSSSLTSFVPYSGDTTGADLFRRTLGTTYIENSGVNDSARISYFSPRFSGLQLGVSYARDGGQTNGTVDNNDNLTDIIDIAANYSGSFGGVSVDASARYGTASGKPGDPDPEIWGAGLKFGMNGFTIGGSFAEQDASEKTDGSSYNVGIGYANGPWSYSLSYFEGNNTDNEGVKGIDAVSGSVAVVGVVGVDANADGDFLDIGDTAPVAAKDAVSGSNAVAGIAGATEELKTIMLAVKYKVASNFSVGAFIADTSFSESVGPADDVDGTVVGVSASFSF